MLQVIVRNLGVRSEYGKKKKKKPFVGFEREVTFGFSRITSVAVLRRKIVEIVERERVKIVEER